MMMAMATCIAVSVNTGPVGLFGKSRTSGTKNTMVTATRGAAAGHGAVDALRVRSRPKSPWHP